MERILTAIIQSKKPLMIVFRSILVLLLIFLGLIRLRLLIILINSPSNFIERDTLTYFLMGKAISAGINPYLPLRELALQFLNMPISYTHPALCTPFMAMISSLISWVSINTFVILWFLMELITLIAIAVMLSLLWDKHFKWFRVLGIVLILLAWYPVMVDLLYGQLSIALTFLLLGVLLALNRGYKILGGILVGLSIAIKIITWPLLLYFALRKDWRALIAGSLTTFALNLIALFKIGINPFLDYYLHISVQASKVYYSVMNNLSIWSVGYRLFNGSPIEPGFLNSPPLINSPGLAPIFSIGLELMFFLSCFVLVSSLNDPNTRFAIMVCLIVAGSPISWIHYYIILIISLIILWHNLVKNSFPKWQTFFSAIITLLLFLSNERINSVITFLNGGTDMIIKNGNAISFVSNLFILIPLFSLLALIVLLSKSNGIRQNSV